MSGHEAAIAGLRRAVETNMKYAESHRKSRDESLQEATRHDGHRREYLALASEYQAAIEALEAQS